MPRDRKPGKAKAPATSRRRFVTPEGVQLELVLAGAGERAAAFAIDLVLQVIVLATVTLLIFWLGHGDKSGIADMIWLLGFFVLRNGWFILFEMSARAGTPGKRLLKLRVVARDGDRLTGEAVVMRNAMREVELFLPLFFLLQRSMNAWDATVTISGLAWTGIFLLFPLFNRDRLRVGDLLAGTWVIENAKATLGYDVGTPASSRRRRQFSDAALDLYGVLELQALEQVLRNNDDASIITVAGTIRRKAGLPDDRDDRGFLEDYYAALCARLERGVLLGRRRIDKHDRGSKRAQVSTPSALALDGSRPPP